MECSGLLSSTARKDEFYPTPPTLANKMLAGIEWDQIQTVLEPSAGKGDLVSEIFAAYKSPYSSRSKNLDVDCIEIDRHLQHILRGENFKVVHDDFLTFESYKQYDLIVMNPPFSDGCRHLLKALEMQKHGGEIVCLLNAETLLNPYTNERKILVDLLAKHEADIAYLDGEFTSSEHKTGVSVALIKIDIEKKREESYFYSCMRKAARYKEPLDEPTELTFSDFLCRITAEYDHAAKAGIALIHEYKALRPYIKRDNNENYAILYLTVGPESNYLQKISVNDFLHDLRYAYWKALFSNKEFMSKLTSALQTKYRAQIEAMVDYDFTSFNIQRILTEMNAKVITGVKDSVMGLFDRLSSEHTYCDDCMNNNIHYFNGWKSNKAHKVNKKVIIPTWGMYSRWGTNRNFELSEALKILGDIEKVFDYLDGGVTGDVNLYNILKEACDAGINRNIRCKYFYVDIYKKGTTHIKFHNMELLERFNIYAAKNRNWLPPDYGKKKYKDMSDEAKRVVDEFQGEKTYEKVVGNSSYFLKDVTCEIAALPESV